MPSHLPDHQPWRMNTSAGLLLMCSLVVLAWLPTAANAAEPCARSSDKRIVMGPEPLARKLYRAACRADAGPWPDGFTSETFTYLGNLRDKRGRTYAIGFLSTTWGESGRATNRILIFDRNGQYLGRFNDLFMPPTLKPPYRLEFANTPKSGNIMSLAGGIPRSAWVDGENHSFESADSTSSHTH